MTDDDAIRRVLLEIVGKGLLRIRWLGEAGHALDCSAEADHLHNLPSLIETVRLGPLRSYYDTERPIFLQRCPTSAEGFQPLWDQLRNFLERGEKESDGREPPA
jgi:hypothetical protein